MWDVLGGTFSVAKLLFGIGIEMLTLFICSFWRIQNHELHRMQVSWLHVVVLTEVKVVPGLLVAWHMNRQKNTYNC